MDLPTLAPTSTLTLRTSIYLGGACELAFAIPHQRLSHTTVVESVLSYRLVTLTRSTNDANTNFQHFSHRDGEEIRKPTAAYELCAYKLTVGSNYIMVHRPIPKTVCSYRPLPSVDQDTLACHGLTPTLKSSPPENNELI
jgi:hypothetical protein